jgi:protein farnesyltransferase subunit beta
MTFRIEGVRHRHKVRFSNNAMPSSNSRAASSHLTTPFEPASQERTRFVIEELTGENTVEEDWEEDPDEIVPMATSMATSPFIPDLYTAFPPIRDILITDTSINQDEIVKQCLPYMSAQSGEFTNYNKYGVPHLDRARHIRFLHKTLQDLPSGFVAADAARPWFFYWALCGLRTLGEDITSYRERLISTVRPMQNDTGGFGGGHGQMSHLAPTYAVVLALAMVGGKVALEVIDRKAMWRWLGTIKQRDGGFQMFIGGEEDVR